MGIGGNLGGGRATELGFDSNFGESECPEPRTGFKNGTNDDGANEITLKSSITNPFESIWINLGLMARTFY